MLPIQTGRLFGLLTITNRFPRTVFWLGRSVTTKAPGCDPKCPKIEQSTKCCRSQDDDDSCLITDPANFWFPGNIFHHKIGPIHHSVDLNDSDSDNDSSSDD